MHQRARFERLCKELEEERQTLHDMREQTATMEREVADKRNHRSPFPKVDVLPFFYYKSSCAWPSSNMKINAYWIL